MVDNNDHLPTRQMDLVKVSVQMWLHSTEWLSICLWMDDHSKRDELYGGPFQKGRIECGTICAGSYNELHLNQFHFASQQRGKYLWRCSCTPVQQFTDLWFWSGFGPSSLTHSYPVFLSILYERKLFIVFIWQFFCPQLQTFGLRPMNCDSQLMNFGPTVIRPAQVHQSWSDTYFTDWCGSAHKARTEFCFKVLVCNQWVLIHN